jgi:hypothetical protein
LRSDSRGSEEYFAAELSFDNDTTTDTDDATSAGAAVVESAPATPVPLALPARVPHTAGGANSGRLSALASPVSPRSVASSPGMQTVADAGEIEDAPAVLFRPLLPTVTATHSGAFTVVGEGAAAVHAAVALTLDGAVPAVLLNLGFPLPVAVQQLLPASPPSTLSRAHAHADCDGSGARREALATVMHQPPVRSRRIRLRGGGELLVDTSLPHTARARWGGSLPADAARNALALQLVDGADHNELICFSATRLALAAFIQTHTENTDWTDDAAAEWSL